MKYPYLVKHNGVYYQAGEEVPESPAPRTIADEESAKTDEKVEIKENVLDKRKAFNLTKTEVNKLTRVELQSLASEYGYDSTLSAQKLKLLFISEFGL